MSSPLYIPSSLGPDKSLYPWTSAWLSRVRQSAICRSGEELDSQCPEEVLLLLRADPIGIQRNGSRSQARGTREATSPKQKGLGLEVRVEQKASGQRGYKAGSTV